MRQLINCSDLLQIEIGVWYMGIIDNNTIDIIYVT